MSPAKKRKRRTRKTARHTWSLALYIAQSLAALGLVAGAAYAFTLFLQKPDYFHVQTIGVSGAQVLAEEDIVAHSGISKADNILLLNPTLIEKRLEALPYVKDCTVTRMFPDRVFIDVEERHAVATLLHGARSFEIDDETVVLRELGITDPPTGPYISGVPKLEYVEEGQQLEDASLVEALDVWRCFSATSMADDVVVSELAAYNVDDIRMYCNDLLFEIRWGRRNYERQSRRLDWLWAANNRQLDCEEYLDTRFEPNLYLR